MEILLLHIFYFACINLLVLLLGYILVKRKMVFAGWMTIDLTQLQPGQRPGSGRVRHDRGSVRTGRQPGSGIPPARTQSEAAARAGPSPEHGVPTKS